MVFGLKLPKMDKNWLVLGGSAILILASAIQLRNNWPGVVPTIPGLTYGSGGPATGIYTGGQAPYTAVPVANPLYQQYVRPTTGPIGADIQQEATKLGLMGLNSGNVGRGTYRDYWTDVYDASKTSASITGDNPAARLTLA